MEVSESSWKALAVKNITKYVHRGGENKGDEPQLIGGTDFLNTIGVAMGLPTSNPENWSKSDLEKALKGQLVFYEGDARQAIDVVADQIRSCCGGDDKNFITVLPVEVYFQEKLYELPLFRVKRYKDSKNYYVDNVGRSYDSVSDWNNNNKLPPGQMAYPTNLRLTLRSNKEAYVTFDSTPCTRLDSKAGRAIDTVAAVAGLTSSVALIFVSGGLAAPLVGTALVTAGWGTGRAGYQLVDKATHGETVNPFANSESRMLWLGIAANLTSFGAMGATMRLTSLAARGREISSAFRVLADIANGTNIAISGLAILNTTIFMITHHEDLTAVDVLMHGASIAFWTKGLFTYKTANTIIRDARNYAFATITKGLDQEQMSEFNTLRNRVQNDAQLLQKFYAAMEANIPPKAYSQLLIDGMHYYDAVSTLTPEQMDAFDSLRLYIKDDTKLISGLNRVADRYNLNPTETMERVLNMWQQMSTSNNNERIVSLEGGNLVLGRAPPIKIDQLGKLSPPMIRFFGEHLSQTDTTTSGQWSTSVPIMLKLQESGMFTVCPVTKIINRGLAVISLNNHLQISIYKLNAISKEDCTKIFKMISLLNINIKVRELPTDVVNLCVVELRLRFECHRYESVENSAAIVNQHSSLLQLVRSDLHSFEKDRLYTFLADIEMYKADLYMEQMLQFVADMKPKNISSLVAYSEFVMACVDDEMILIKQKIANKELSLPINTKKAVWTRNKAIEKVFEDRSWLRQKYVETERIVRNNDMVGTTVLSKNLSDQELVGAMRNKIIKFGSEPSAVYHIVKHPTKPKDVYITRANETIRNTSGEWTVSIGQDGDNRMFTFVDSKGKCLVLEKDGRVLLCSFTPKEKR